MPKWIKVIYFCSKWFGGEIVFGLGHEKQIKQADPERWKDGLFAY